MAGGNIDIQHTQNGDSEVVVDCTDEEFLNLWRHPLDEYGVDPEEEKRPGKLKEQRHKIEKMQRMLRKRGKHNRSMRRDASNFVHGSNAVIVDKIPRQRLVNRP